MSEDKDELASVITLSSDNYPLGRILKKIESDVASLSSRSASSTSTRVGIASEKGIAAMGHLANGWVERVQRRVKLHKIDAYLKSHEDYIPPEYYEDLLELQRTGLYPKRVRRQAWNLIIVLLQRQRVERIVDVIVTWPSIEIQLFVRQLAAFKLSGWTIYPGKVVECSEGPSTSTSPLPPPELNLSHLISSCRAILSSLLRQDPDLLHQFLGVDEYLALQLPSIEDHKCEVLTLFFVDLADNFVPSSSNPWILPPFAHDFVEFLRTGHLLQVKPVVDYIIQAYRSIKASIVYLPQLNDSHPFLWFTAHLFLSSPIAKDEFLNQELLDIVESIWSFHIRTDSLNVDHSSPSQIASCLILGAYSAMEIYPSLAQYLKEHKVDWFLDIFTHYTSNHLLISRICSSRGKTFVSGVDDRQEFYNALFELVANPHPDDDIHQRVLQVVIHELEGVGREHYADAIIQLPEDRRGHAVSQLMILRLIRQSDLDSSSKFNGNFRRILKALKSKSPDPNILYDNIDIGDYALAQTDVQSVAGERAGTDDALSKFFNELALQDIAPERGCRIPPNAHNFVLYASSAPPKQRNAVIDYVLSVLAILVSDPCDSDAHPTLPESLPNLTEACLCPQSPFLLFIIHLAFHSPDAAHYLLDNGIIAMLRQTWPTAMSDSRQLLASITLSTQILLVFAVLAKHDLTGLLSQLRDCQPDSWFIDPSLPITNVHLSLWLGRDSWRDLSGYLRLVTEGVGENGDMYTLVNLTGSEPVEDLLTIIGSEEVADETRKEAARQFLTICAVTSEANWIELVGNVNLVIGFSMCEYLFRVYLGRPSNGPRNLADDVKTHLGKLEDLSKSLDYQNPNVIVRLVNIIYQVTCQVSGRDRRLRIITVKNGGFYDLIHDLDGGFFYKLGSGGSKGSGGSYSWIISDLESVLEDLESC